MSSPPSGWRRAERNEDEALYDSFRAYVPMRKIQVEGETGPSDEKRHWTAFETGPRLAPCPLVMLPPVCGRADCFYKQQVALANLGYRTVALEWPPYWSIPDLIAGFRTVMETLRIQQCHLFGASLGGYIAQKIAEAASGGAPHRRCPVASLVLLNSFSRTDIFKRHTHTFFYWACPSAFLKRSIAARMPRVYADGGQARATDFMVGQLESLGQTALAARMTLNCARGACDTRRLANVPVTVIDVFDSSGISQQGKSHMVQGYPHARRAHIKTGGSFPFLSRPADVNMFLQVHLRDFDDGPLSAAEVRQAAARRAEPEPPAVRAQ